jgi:hypothetical protein
MFVDMLLLKFLDCWPNTNTLYTMVDGERFCLQSQSVQRLATGWVARGSNPGGGEIFLTHA